MKVITIDGQRMLVSSYAKAKASGITTLKGVMNIGPQGPVDRHIIDGYVVADAIGELGETEIDGNVTISSRKLSETEAETLAACEADYAKAKRLALPNRIVQDFLNRG